MRAEKYKPYFTEEYLMGPNSIRLIDELLSAYPLHLNKESKVLDLGCGTGLTSFFIAAETSATVYANDLWIAAKDNSDRFKSWNVEGSVIPFQQDANELHFDISTFDAILSVDAYHYFAAKEGFFCGKILPFLKGGGMALFAVPGVKEEYEGRQNDVLQAWVGEDAHMFHSCSWWKHIIGEHADIAFVETWELHCFAAAWEEWLKIDSQYADEDRAFFESVIRKYSNFVGIAVKRR